MTTTLHPDDVELFEYVEGELDPARRTAVAEHLARCLRCADEVRQLEAGKAALRQAPLLELPPRRREALLGSLPRQTERTPLVWSPKRLVAVLTPVAAVIAVVAVIANTDGGVGEEEEAAAPAEVRVAEEQAKSGDFGAQAPAAEAPAAAAEAAPAAPVEETPPAEEAAPAEQAAPPGEAAPPGQAAPPEQAAPAEQATPAEQAVPAAPGVESATPVLSVAGPAEDVAAFLREQGFDARVVGENVEVRGADRAAVEQALAKRAPGDVAVVLAP